MLFIYCRTGNFLWAASDPLTARQWWRQSAQLNTGRPRGSSSDSSQGPSARITNIPSCNHPDDPLSPSPTPLLRCSEAQYISRRGQTVWPWHRRAQRGRLWWRLHHHDSWAETDVLDKQINYFNKWKWSLLTPAHLYFIASELTLTTCVFL